MNRRRFLWALPASAAGWGCAARKARPALPTQTEATRRLARVKVTEDRIIRTVAGLRPFRPSGFVVKAGKLDDKTIVHNYGHGGGGITLSWGTSQLAVDLALQAGHSKCAVLGCGAVGLASARLLQRRGFEVTIYAKDLPPNTTSNIAGGFWAPTSVFAPRRPPPEFMEQFRRASQLAWRDFQDLIGDYYGVHWIETYFLSETRGEQIDRDDPEFGLLRDIRELARSEHPFAQPYVTRLVTMLIEPPIYLNAMMRDFLLAGGRIVVREFANRNDLLALPEPVLINCTGLGAKALFEDAELLPIKGQLTVLVPQPEVDYATSGPGGLYMFSRKDGILLGGTFERGVWTLEPNQQEAERILSGHRKIFEAMARS